MKFFIDVDFWRMELSNISDSAVIGKGSTIHSHVVIYDDVIIGNNCKIQARAFIPNGITLENNVFIGPAVVFTNDPKPPSDHKGWEKTLVKEGASIGANSTILSGLTIGKNAMVGAASLVTKDIPDGEVWVGSPAKFYKKRKDL